MEPLISVITVSYNASQCIEDTILSIIEQRYDNFEYIIIDGGSSDTTLNIIRKYQSKITHCISEPDAGIYDAMNKGVHKSKGKYIIFINAGDTLCNNETLKNCASVLKADPTIDVLYGNTILKYSFGSYITKPAAIQEISKHMFFCHQSSFCKRELLEKYPFDTKFKIAADYNLFKSLYVKHSKFKYYDMCIAIYEAEDGLSSKSHHKLLKEYSIINQIKHPWLNASWWGVYIHKLLKLILPSSLYIKLKKSRINGVEI